MQNKADFAIMSAEEKGKEEYLEVWLRDTPYHVHNLHSAELHIDGLPTLNFRLLPPSYAGPETLVGFAVVLSTRAKAHFDGNRPDKVQRRSRKAGEDPHGWSRSDYPSYTGFPNMGAFVLFAAMALINPDYPQRKMNRVRTPRPEGAQNIYYPEYLSIAVGFCSRNLLFSAAERDSSKITCHSF